MELETMVSFFEALECESFANNGFTEFYRERAAKKKAALKANIARGRIIK